MNEHLPECWAKDPSDPEAWCICEELRACEQRVLTEAPVSVFAKAFHDGKAVGYGIGLSDARDAVAALPKYAMRDRCLAALDSMKEKQ